MKNTFTRKQILIGQLQINPPYYEVFCEVCDKNLIVEHLTIIVTYRQLDLIGRRALKMLGILLLLKIKRGISKCLEKATKSIVTLQKT